MAHNQTRQKVSVFALVKPDRIISLVTVKENIISDIVAFKDNLDLQLEDLALERAGTSIDFYFDTSDIYQAVLGLEAFYTLKENFDVKRFKDKRALVHSLAVSGWIGEVQLLAPHQTEFLAQMRLQFGIGIDMDPKGSARRFLQDLGLTDVEQFRKISFERFKRNQFYDFIKQQAGLAETLFKAVHCMVPWHRRLPRLLSRNILITTKPVYDFDRVIQTEHFKALKRSFAKRRPHTQVNNIADAAAISTLIDKIQDYKRGSAKRLPRFLIPSSLFLEVISDSGVTSLLSYRNPGGSQSSVLRDCDYYIYRASLLQRNRFSDKDHLKRTASQEYMRGLNAKVSSIIESQKVLAREVLEKVDFQGAPLSEAIKDFQMFSFLENVWLKYEALEDMSKAVEMVAEIAREMRSKTFQQGVERAIDTLRQKIGEGASEFRWISSIWTRLEKGAEGLRTRSDINTFDLPNFFRELGLLRYGFPPSAHENIRNVLQELLRGEVPEEDARIAVIKACYRGRAAPSKNIDNLVTGAAVLLVTRMDSELLWLLNKIRPLPHFSLRIVLAEMLFKLNPKSERGATLLKRLEKEYNDSVKSGTRCDIAVGIAYLLIRLWRARGGHPSWAIHPASAIEAQGELSRLYLDKAVMYAQQAYNLLEHDPMKQIYALNQYLFYLVEGGSDERLPEMKKAALELVAFKADRELWQYRFDDTLARYFYRLATIAEDKEKWIALVTQAKRCSDEAHAKSHGDVEVDQFSTLLAVQLTAGYAG